MWNGNVTIYSPNGDPMESFHADDIICIYAGAFPTVCFVKGKYDYNDPSKVEVIMETNLPFIMEGKSDVKNSYQPKYIGKLYASNGKVVKEFNYAMRRFVYIWEYELDGENKIYTSFLSLQKEIK